MTVVLDTNALVQMFGQTSPLAPLKRALLDGRLTLAVSTAHAADYCSPNTGFFGGVSEA